MAAPEDLAVDMEAVAEVVAYAKGGTARLNGDSSLDFS